MCAIVTRYMAQTSLWLNMLIAPYQLSSGQYPLVALLSQFFTESQKPCFHQAKVFFVIINSTIQWGLYWPFLLYQAKNCCWLLVNDEEDTIKKLLYSSLFSRPSTYYQWPRAGIEVCVRSGQLTLGYWWTLWLPTYYLKCMWVLLGPTCDT